MAVCALLKSSVVLGRDEYRVQALRTLEFLIENLWHERAGVFPGPELAVGADSLALVVPLLALPQATHYLLDAWIWRIRPENPELARHLSLPGQSDLQAPG